MPRRRYRDATPELIRAARQLRAGLTPAEERIWAAIRRRQVGGARFRRQYPFAGFVLDFCCPEHRLVVEVDGSVHDDPDQAAYDQGRTEQLEAHGYRVLRFRNEQVLHDLDTVLAQIASAIEAAPSNSPFPPSATGGRGPGG